MLARYVAADLLRNPRRTLSTMTGVTLGVGQFCGVLFFVDGLSASMTQRAVAPLAIDMQLVVTQPIGAALTMSQVAENPMPDATRQITLNIANTGNVAAHDVTVRSVPRQQLAVVPGSARLDGTLIKGSEDNPFAHGDGQTGLNLGTLEQGGSRRLTYLVRGSGEVGADAALSTYSSRENPLPVAANEPKTVDLRALATRIAEVDGVAAASPLTMADLGVARLAAGGATAAGPAKIFAFDAAYAARDDTIVLTDGELSLGGAVFSAEAAETLRVGPGGTVSVRLPDNSTVDLKVTGIADLSQPGHCSPAAARRGLGDVHLHRTFRRGLTRNLRFGRPACFRPRSRRRAGPHQGSSDPRGRRRREARSARRRSEHGPPRNRTDRR